MKNLISIIRIDWKRALRSPLWHRKLIVNLFLGLTFLYMASMFLILGIVLDDILIKIPFEGIDYRTFGESFVLRRLNQFLLYYFLADLILRYFMQKLPAMAVQPYLHLPLKRSNLVHFMLVKTIWSPFNLLYILIFLPFVIELFDNLDFLPAFGWTIGFVATIYCVNFFLIFIKRTSDVDTRVYLGMLAGFIAIVGLDWYDIVDFQHVSALFFNTFFIYPVTVLIPIALAGFCYWLNFRYVRANLYLSRLSKTTRNEVSYVGSGILARFGIVGRLTELEFKFIWRNKRPKSVLLITVLFLGYGLLVFPNEEYAGNYLMYVLFSIIITGMFMLNYGQYLLGWEGSHFDHILTRNVSFKDYYLSKYLLFAIVSASAMILSIPYAYFGWEVLLVLFSVFLFNLGVGSHFVMFFGSLNPKKIDLSQGSMLNWQGVGAAQFLLVIPVLGLPLAVFGIGSFIWGSTEAILLIGLLGLLGLAGTRIWIGLLAKWLEKQRYEISNDFRNQ